MKHEDKVLTKPIRPTKRKDICKYLSETVKDVFWKTLEVTPT